MEYYKSYNLNLKLNHITYYLTTYIYIIKVNILKIKKKNKVIKNDNYKKVPF